MLFFFKHKTAYEVRISDWSSDVCASDLDLPVMRGMGDDADHFAAGRQRGFGDHAHQADAAAAIDQPDAVLGQHAPEDLRLGGIDLALAEAGARSEEHTSELQSLMRISYAVFCLKKKTKS